MTATRILLVEDEPVSALNLRQSLTTLGYDVPSVATTGAQALALIEREKPDLILMDIHIAGEIDGIETAARISSDLWIPVIYVTAYSDQTTLRRAAATKPYGYLLKPFSDPTLHVTIQLALQRHGAELALRLAEDELRQAQKLEAIGQLTGGVSHDFNNLLAIIQGNLELIGEKAAGNPAIREMVADALRATERGAILTQRLLAYSRQQPLEPRTLALSELVSELILVLRRTLGETIEVGAIMSPDLWQVRIDPHQLENALLNLAVNARDAMPNGGRLTIEGFNAILDADYAAQNAEVKPGDYALLAVTDTGAGMSPAVMKHAFEPFFTTKSVGRGPGLGLSMVFGFVKQSGGHIKIYSEPGLGTTVKLYLPKATTDSGGTAAPDPDRASLDRAMGETVMVVEDDDDVRKLAVTLLRGLGYLTMDAQDGPSALELLAREPRVDLLLTDVVLPKDMNGPALAAAAQRLMPKLKILYMSGYTRNAILRDDLLGEGVHLLMKPFHKAELAAKIRQILNERT